MPFGLSTKSIVVGMILGAVIIPRVTAMVSNRTAAK